MLEHGLAAGHSSRDKTLSRSCQLGTGAAQSAQTQIICIWAHAALKMATTGSVLDASGGKSVQLLYDVSPLQVAPRPAASIALEYEPGFVEPPHAHPRAQLLYPTRGVLSVMTDHGAFLVPPQLAIWIPSCVQHEVHCRGRVHVRTLYVDPLCDPALPLQPYIMEVPDLMRSLIVETMRFPLDYNLEGREAQIVSLLLREICSRPVDERHLPLPQSERIAHVCRAILKDLQGDGTIEQWAHKLGMSRRTLCRLFRRETGMGFSAWRQHARLLEAISLLAAGHPITTVAFDVGYDSASSFTAMFRRATGMTPSEYMTRFPITRRGNRRRTSVSPE